MVATKKVFLIGLILGIGWITTSCTGSGKGTSGVVVGDTITKEKVRADAISSEMSLAIEREVVLERVRSIYSLIKQECTYLGGSVENDWLDKSFCTKRWNSLLMSVRRKEFLTNSLFFEVNRWTMTYDSNLISFDEFEVADCRIDADNKKTATVNFTVYAQDTYTPVRIELVFEDGQWKIDNFYHMKYFLDLRQSMCQYLGRDMMYLI